MTRKEAVGRTLARALRWIAQCLAEIGMDASRDGEWRVTIVMRRPDCDDATVICGHDDEATLIVALQHLGASRGRATYLATPDSVRDDPQ